MGATATTAMLPPEWRILYSLLLVAVVFAAQKEDDGDDEDDEEESSGDVYKFLYKRMQQDAKVKKRLAPSIYSIPGWILILYSLLL